MTYKGRDTMSKKVLSFLLAAVMLFGISGYARADSDYTYMESDSGEVDVSIFEDDEEAVTSQEEIDIAAPYAILMEKETGTVIYEKDADEKVYPASVTKVMSLLLFVEAIESGHMSLDDTVIVSDYAASMGGSHVYLEEGEQMSVRDMLKCIVVSSANDATVALAEHIAGTEQAFTTLMNERAAELGMTNTVFCNCTGLLEQPEHVTTARDVAIMSRELIKHDMIKEYTGIWMDTIRNGEFGLSNTNKLIRYYDGATGLKTGFTSTAMYCLSATAERDGVEYIAVVMHCETSQDRFESAKVLLNYAFANYALANTASEEKIEPVTVKMGKEDSVSAIPETEEKILVKKSDIPLITQELDMEESLTAPVQKGQRVGTLTIYKGDEVLLEIPVTAGETVERVTTGDIFKDLLGLIFAGAVK
jgi:D-alanyl-D-alanine carboxypeptidase (penicillin-binding protein 5/6)